MKKIYKGNINKFEGNINKFAETNKEYLLYY